MDGRTGTAIGIPSADGVVRTDIIIDPTSGLVIGEPVETRGMAAKGRPSLGQQSQGHLSQSYHFTDG
ncbi:hypothetical protein QFZ33_002523 [Arthrobacter globiformis]|nr:hypothetical protein [Arthrobacter globiformis]